MKWLWQWPSVWRIALGWFFFPLLSALGIFMSLFKVTEMPLRIIAMNRWHLYAGYCPWVKSPFGHSSFFFGLISTVLGYESSLKKHFIYYITRQSFLSLHLRMSVRVRVAQKMSGGKLELNATFKFILWPSFLFSVLCLDFLVTF